MKRWGVRASFLSTDTNADAGQNTWFNHLTLNVLYTILGTVILISNLSLN